MHENYSVDLVTNDNTRWRCALMYSHSVKMVVMNSIFKEP